jgi:MoxR-like ATPase
VHWRKAARTWPFEDIRHFATEVLGHRVLLNYDGLAENIGVGALVGEIAQGVAEAA